MDIKKLEGILRKHALWVETSEKKGEKADLQDANLQDSNLRFANLKFANLNRANLRGADLRGVNFFGANLYYANLQFTNLHRSHLMAVNLLEANLQKANLQETNCQEANLWKADLQEANLQKANLQKANLHYANLRKCNLSEANFLGADIRNADFQNASFENADFRGARVNNESLIYFSDMERMKVNNDEFILIKLDIAAINEDLIERFIEFPPEYHQAGISILNYFGTVLKKKYPDTKAKVKIEQDGLKVKMVIDPVDGRDHEIIEKALDEYGLVVTGKMTPEEYCNNDPLQIMELKSQLSIAQVQIDNQKQIIEYQAREIRKQDEQVKNKSEESARKDIQIDRLLNLLESGLKSDPKKKEQDAEAVKVFISCTEDDMLTANKIYADLQKEGIITPWVAHKDINAGEKTEFAVRRAIKDSDYFLALLSTSSVSEKGAFQKELKQAFDILSEHSQDAIFIIPVRLEDCNPGDILNGLHIIDLHKGGYNSGLEKIIQAMRQK